MMSRALVALLILLLGARAMPADWSLGVASSMTKVPQTGEVPPVGPEGLALSLAGNEREAVQLVVTAGAEGLRQVRVRTTEPRGDRGGLISADRVQLNLVAYVPVPALDRWDPDPLPPNGPFDVEPGRNQPVWITVAAPPGQAAGVYRGEVTVAPEGGPSQSVPLTVTVYGFSLPAHPFGATAFGLYTGAIAQQHGVAEDSPEFASLHRRYYECLLDHLISTYNIPAGLETPEAEPYLNDPRLTSYVIPYSDDEAKLKGTCDFLRNHDWLGKGYFYPLDEPVTKEQYDRGLEIWAKIKRAAPDARIVAPFFRGPDFVPDKTIFDLAAGYLNIWCINTGYFSDPRVRAAMYQRGKLGEELWWYVCCGPGGPFANFFVQEDAIDHRVLFWQQKKYGITGLLYWNATYWSPANGTADPWTDMATVKDINPNIYGDGSLLYPGGKVGVDGPVSSMRLELIRDGVEDYQYLCLLQRAAGLAEAQGAADRVAQSLTEYVKDPAELLRAREDVAQRIVRAGR